MRVWRLRSPLQPVLHYVLLINAFLVLPFAVLRAGYDLTANVAEDLLESIMRRYEQHSIKENTSARRCVLRLCAAVNRSGCTAASPRATGVRPLLSPPTARLPLRHACKGNDFVIDQASQDEAGSDLRRDRGVGYDRRVCRHRKAAAAAAGAIPGCAAAAVAQTDVDGPVGHGRHYVLQERDAGSTTLHAKQRGEISRLVRRRRN